MTIGELESKSKFNDDKESRLSKWGHSLTNQAAELKNLNSELAAKSGSHTLFNVSLPTPIILTQPP